MMFKGLSISILVWVFLITGCGNHQQSLSRIEAKETINEVGEDSDELELIKAVNGGDIERIKHFFAKGVSKDLYNQEGLTLVMIAIKSLQYAVLEFLITQGADVELRSKSDAVPPDHSAIEFLEALDTDDSVQLDPVAKEVMVALLNGEKVDGTLFNEFPDTNPNSNKLYGTIIGKNIDLLKFMLAKGADINLQTPDAKSTPLLHLISNSIGFEKEEFAEMKSVFELLITHPEIDVNVKPDRARANALCRALQLKSRDPNYAYYIDRLQALGAKPVGRRCQR